ncbi:MAG: DUF1080 domain-containing protein [Planctomycetes bacterium]|nr:DUF1080 domain-containing protein [Planctomycetota bacterium]
MLVAIATVLAATLPQDPPIRAVVITGANNHDWKWTAPEIAGALRETGRFVVQVEDQPQQFLATALALHAAGQLDLLVLDYNGPRWGEAAEQGFLAAVRAGCGVSVLHASNNAFPGWTDYENLVGLLWRDGTGHGAYHPFDCVVVDPHHPITRGMADLRLHPDELYHRLVPAPAADYRVLLSAFSEPKTGGTGRHEPMGMVSTWGQGRVFHTPLGHVWTGVPATHATWGDPQLRRFVARGCEWAATGRVTLAPEPINWLSEEERQAGFERLFDGRKLTGWRAYQGDGPPAQGWSVQDGAIVHQAGGGGGDLVSDEQYGDFDFRFSFRVAANANSGVMWHVQENAEQTYMSGPEYQVLDDAGVRPDARHGVAALYDMVPPTAPPLRPAGTWNTGRIVVQQGKLSHWLNGVCVLEVPCQGPQWQAMVQQSKFRDWPFGQAEKGHLALQDHGDEVAYRDLRIRRL